MSFISSLAAARSSGEPRRKSSSSFWGTEAPRRPTAGATRSIRAIDPPEPSWGAHGRRCMTRTAACADASSFSSSSSVSKACAVAMQAEGGRSNTANRGGVSARALGFKDQSGQRYRVGKDEVALGLVERRKAVAWGVGGTGINGRGALGWADGVG